MIPEVGMVIVHNVPLNFMQQYIYHTMFMQYHINVYSRHFLAQTGNNNDLKPVVRDVNQTMTYAGRFIHPYM